MRWTGCPEATCRSAPAAAAEDAPGERDRRELVRGRGGERARLELQGQAAQLVPLGGVQAVWPPYEVDETAPLLAVQRGQVAARQQRDLGHGEHFEHGE